MRNLPHETIEHALAIKLARRVATARWPSNYAGLSRQASRAANSVVLNLAEASWKSGKAARLSYRIALGELGEAAAAMQLGKIRCWRQLVEPLYERLLPLAECGASTPAPPAACSVASSSGGTSSSRPIPTSRTAPSPPSARPHGGETESEFPPGSPFMHKFDGPGGLPRNMKDWEFLRRWMAAAEERVHRGEFDAELCDPPDAERV